MASYNKVILAGFISREVELRYLPNGTAVAQFGIATNREWKSESGEKKTEVCFVDISAFGRTAEVLAQYVKKGDPLMLDGRLKLESWEDRQTHEKKQKLKVILETFTFLKSGSDRGDDSDRPAQPRQPTAREQARSQAKADKPGEGDDYPPGLGPDDDSECPPF